MKGYAYKLEGYSGVYHYNEKDQFHREDGPAIESSDGGKAWYINGKLHRLDGPAREYPNGYKQWLINGQRHRTDGPAIEDSDGYKEWWINDKPLTEEEFNRLTTRLGKALYL